MLQCYIVSNISSNVVYAGIRCNIVSTLKGVFQQVVGDCDYIYISNFIMASYGPPNKRKGTYLYECQQCGKEWMKRDSQGKADACSECSNITRPKRMRKMFGEFRCDCGHTWASAHCWEIVVNRTETEMIAQKCRDCEKSVLPHTLRPLRKGAGDGGPPHMQEHCGMCKKLGHNCTEVDGDGDDREEEVEGGGDDEGSHPGADTEDDLADNLENLRFS